MTEKPSSGVYATDNPTEYGASGRILEPFTTRSTNFVVVNEKDSGFFVQTPLLVRDYSQRLIPVPTLSTLYDIVYDLYQETFPSVELFWKNLQTSLWTRTLDRERKCTSSSTGGEKEQEAHNDQLFVAIDAAGQYIIYTKSSPQIIPRPTTDYVAFTLGRWSEKQVDSSSLLPLHYGWTDAQITKALQSSNSPAEFLQTLLLWEDYRNITKYGCW